MSIELYPFIDLGLTCKETSAGTYLLVDNSTNSYFKKLKASVQFNFKGLFFVRYLSSFSAFRSTLRL